MLPRVSSRYLVSFSIPFGHILYWSEPRLEVESVFLEDKLAPLADCVMLSSALHRRLPIQCGPRVSDLGLASICPAITLI